MEVAPFFVDFHHFLSIFTIFCRFSRFTHFCRDLHFVEIYALFPQFFLAKIAISATSHVFCMYAPAKWTQTENSQTAVKRYHSQWYQLANSRFLRYMHILTRSVISEKTKSWRFRDPNSWWWLSPNPEALPLYHCWYVRLCLHQQHCVCSGWCEGSHGVLWLHLTF